MSRIGVIVTVGVQVAILPIPSSAVIVTVFAPKSSQSKEETSRVIREVTSQPVDTTRAFVASVIEKSVKVPVSPPASSQIDRVQSPFTSSPANVLAKVPPSGWNVPVKGADPVVTEGAPS